MSALTIYHNPKCSKSRETLALLQGRGTRAAHHRIPRRPRRRAAELTAIVRMLGIRPEALVRKGEDVFKAEICRQDAD